jgi:hypothetical protein
MVEQMNVNGYRASGSPPFHFTVEGPTREEAIARFREQVRAQLASGAEIVQVEIQEPEPHYAKFVGTWKPGDPEIEAWKEAVEEYRQEVENDPNIP